MRHFATENRSPFTRRGLTGKSYGELSVPDTDISFVSSGRPSIDRIFPAFYDNTETSRTPPRLSNFSDIDSNYSFESLHHGRKSLDQGGFSPELSTFSNESDQMPSAAVRAFSHSFEYQKCRTCIFYKRISLCL